MDLKTILSQMSQRDIREDYKYLKMRKRRRDKRREESSGIRDD